MPDVVREPMQMPSTESGSVSGASLSSTVEHELSTRETTNSECARSEMRLMISLLCMILVPIVLLFVRDIVIRIHPNDGN